MVSKIQNDDRVFVQGKIIEHKKLTTEYYRMKIRAPKISRIAKPGQFIMLSKWQIKDLLLKRPFSFYQIEPDKESIGILYKKVGKGTSVLAESKPGATVELIGPLGNGFYIPKNAKKIAIVGRGIGVVPLIPLIQSIREREIEICSFVSARKKSLLLCNNELESVSNNIFYTTDDGLMGATGKVTRFLEEILLKNGNYFDAVYTCGSKRLASDIKKMQDLYHFPAFISMEERMACGIGSCKGCVINTTTGYQRVCKEGPIFPLEEVIM